MSRRSHRKKRESEPSPILPEIVEKKSYLSTLDEILSLLNELNEADLHFLNDAVIERINILQKTRSLRAMSKFNRRDKVAFDHNGRIIEGRVVSLNQKSVSVETKDHGRWRIPPHLLNKVQDI